MRCVTQFIYKLIGLVLCLCLLSVICPASLQTGKLSSLKELGRTKSFTNLLCVTFTMCMCSAAKRLSLTKAALFALRASLYERPVNLETAKAAHAEFRRVMREAGVKVLTVRDVMAYGVGDHSARCDLLFTCWY